MPVRIYDLAKKLGIESKKVLDQAKNLGIAQAKVPSSSLDKITAEFLENELVKLFPPPAGSPAPPPPDFPAPAPIFLEARPSITLITEDPPPPPPPEAIAAPPPSEPPPVEIVAAPSDSGVAPPL